MNLFESTLSDALHHEAQEIAMSADFNDGRDSFETRLDDVDRDRRRRQIVLGVLAAAAAVAAIAFFAVGRPVAAPTPGGPTPSPTASPTAIRSAAFSSSAFAFPFSVLTPAWVTEALDEPTSENSRHVTWNRCEGDICIGLTYLSLSKLDPFGLEPRKDTAMPDYQGYLDYLDSLVADGKAVYEGQSGIEVGGRQGELLTLMPLTDIPDGVGCEAGDGSSEDCWDFFEGVATRMAIVDVGSSNPLVILTRTPPDNPDGDRWVAQFDPMLKTVTLDLASASPMLGVWRSSTTRDQVAALLADQGLQADTARVLKEIEPAGDPITWELWVDPTWYRLYAVTSDGTKVKLDEHTYQRSGDTVTGTTVDGSSLVTISTVALDGEDLRWTIESADANPDPSAVSEEAMARVLYTSSTWVRSTT